MQFGRNIYSQIHRGAYRGRPLFAVAETPALLRLICAGPVQTGR